MADGLYESQGFYSSKFILNVDREEKKMPTILVVEDTPSQLELMNYFLLEGGYEVIGATKKYFSINLMQLLLM